MQREIDYLRTQFNLETCEPIDSVDYVRIGDFELPEPDSRSSRLAEVAGVKSAVTLDFPDNYYPDEAGDDDFDKKSVDKELVYESAGVMKSQMGSL